jgi:hypothetical protein
MAGNGQALDQLQATIAATITVISARSQLVRAICRSTHKIVRDVPNFWACRSQHARHTQFGRNILDQGAVR